MIRTAGGALVRSGHLRLGGQRGLDQEAAAGSGAGAQLTAGRRGTLVHAGQPVPPGGHRLRRGRARAVVADTLPHGVIREAQLHVDRGARRVPPGVGERFLDDAVGGELDAGIEGGREAGDD